MSVPTSGVCLIWFLFFFSSRRRHTRSKRDWSSDVCSSDLGSGRISSGQLRCQADGLVRFSAHGKESRPPGGKITLRPHVIEAGGSSEKRVAKRSEERRVGEERRERRRPEQCKRKRSNVKWV